MKSSIRDRHTLARLLRCLRACTPRRPRRVFLEEAEIELWGLYRREQAELLRQASSLRTRPSGRARWKIEPVQLALDPDRARAWIELALLARGQGVVRARRSAMPTADSAVVDRRSAESTSRHALLDRRSALRDWRARAAECAALCAYDGYPLAPDLAVCLAHPVHHWPSVRQLRGVARRLGARVD